MSVIQKQIIDLNNKVDQLHEVVERLTEQIGILAAQKPPSSSKKEEINLMEPMIGRGTELLGDSQSLREVSCSSIIDHKDIIKDQESGHKSPSQSYYSETYLPPEIQIRRLTAQLTAAYNRIAVLEEQLLARRIHH